MKSLALLGTTLGFAFAAGLNLYATVLVIGAAVRFGWIALPPALHSLAVLGHPLVMSVAGLLYLVEFVADKVPAVDHAWDAVHTFIRPAGAVWIAWRTIGGSGLPEPAEVALLLAAGGVALTTHAGKAGTRLAVGASGGHFVGLGILLSLLEDLAAFVVAPLSLLVPLLMLLVVAAGVAGGIWLLLRTRRRRARTARTRE
jgi:hypothetical protein